MPETSGLRTRRPARLYVGITSQAWINRAAAGQPEDLANFWRPSGDRGFSILSPGEFFLFKLHAPAHSVVGCGVFREFRAMPLGEAWELFGTRNGVGSLEEMRERVGTYARGAVPRDDHRIGCILLDHLTAWPERLWMPPPTDWSINIVQGRSYTLDSDVGAALLRGVLAREPGLSEIDTRRAR